MVALDSRIQRDDAFTVAILRAGVVFGLIGIALIHFLDVFAKLNETPYLGGLYIALMLGCVVVGERLLRREEAALWTAAAVLAGLTLFGYVLSRSVGLPSATADIGNWEEPLGLASLFVEGLVILLSGYALAITER
jgi:hypothetical protein